MQNEIVILAMSSMPVPRSPTDSNQSRSMTTAQLGGMFNMSRMVKFAYNVHKMIQLTETVGGNT